MIEPTLGSEMTIRVAKALGPRRYLAEPTDALWSLGGRTVTYVTRRRTPLEGEVIGTWVLAIRPDEIVVSSDDFGMVIGETMRSRYLDAATTADRFIGGGQELDREPLAHALSVVKGMFGRAYKRDQPDWFAVRALLGSPHDREAERLREMIASLRTSLVRGEDAQVSQQLERLVREGLPSILQRVIQALRPGADL